MISKSAVYSKVENWLIPYWPLMLLLSVLLIGVTIYLVVSGKRVPLAGWLTYMFMP